MNYFKKILRFAKPYKIYAILNIISNIFYALFSTLAMISLFPMLNVLFNQTEKIYTKPKWSGISNLKDYVTDSLNFYITKQSQQTDSGEVLMYMVGLIITMFLLKNLFNYLAMYFITFLRNGVLKDLRNELYDKTVELPISYYSEKRKGDTIARITSDVLEIQHSFLSILELIVREPLTIIFTIIAMLTISPKLTLFVFLFLPLSGFLISLIGKSLKRKSDKVQQEQGYFLSILEETLGGLRVIKAFNAESVFARKFQSSTKRFFNFSNSLLNRQNLASPTSEFFGIAAIGVILWYGGQMVLVEKTLEAELFITYMALSYQILTPAKAISKASYGVKKGNAAAERVLEVLETENPISEIDNPIQQDTFTKAVKIDNISFKYEDEYVLKNFNLTVEKGKTVALVGQSGSGKSTIANLVTRFYDVNEGEISIDGNNIKNLSKKSLRGLLGLVTQDSILFNDTVKNNIGLGKENATDEEIIAAAKIANAHD
ncbi:MAG: ABC transporter ATP-binding protein, partial [Maribacter dokdonensis]